MYRSSDGAESWVPAGLEGRSVTDLYWLGPLLYAVAADGLYRSQNLGRDWQRIDEGLGEARPKQILFPLAPESGAVLFMATDKGVFRSYDGGVHWVLAGFAGRDVITLATFPPPSRNEGPR